MTNTEARKECRSSLWFFVGVEVLTALAWIGLLVERRFSVGSGLFTEACLWTLGSSIVLLLFVLPWFWATLRHVALIGWLMGVSSIWWLLFSGPVGC